MKSGITIRYAGDCAADKQDIITGFQQAMKTILETHTGCSGATYACSVEDIEVLCGESTRRKRSLLASRVDRDADAVQIVTVHFSVQESIANKTQYEVSADDQRQLLNDMDVLYGVIYEEFAVDDARLDINGQELEVMTYFDVTETFEFVGNCSEGEVTDFRDSSARCCK